MINIYIKNLSYDAVEDDLRALFEKYGEVSSVNIIRDRESGRSRGFAFVEMPNDEEGRTAIAKITEEETEVVGRKIFVNETRPKEERSRGPRGGDRRY